MLIDRWFFLWLKRLIFLWVKRLIVYIRNGIDGWSHMLLLWWHVIMQWWILWSRRKVWHVLHVKVLNLLRFILDQEDAYKFLDTFGLHILVEPLWVTIGVVKGLVDCCIGTLCVPNTLGLFWFCWAEIACSIWDSCLHRGF